MSSLSDGVREVLGPGGALARALPGWEHRPQQLEVALAVAEAIEEGHPLLVEAGTGTGKTLAYLVPAALSGKRVLISTATRTLQEQLLAKDVPLLEAALGRSVDAAVLKGISNYVCLRKYTETADADDPALGDISAWLGKTLTGDRAELIGVLEEAPAWRLVTTTPDARLGPRCPFFERCFVTKARRAAAKAQIVIVNHHLFFADAALRRTYPGAQILPDADVVVFDEAHALEEVATEHFGVDVSTLRVAALVRDARKALPEDVAMIGNIESRADSLFAAIRRHTPMSAETEASRISAPDDLFAGDRRDAWFRLDAALEELHHRAQRLGATRDDEVAAGVARRAGTLRDDLALIADPPAGQRRHVHWVELRGRAVLLHASPIDVAPLLAEHVLAAYPSTILTSATLAADGSFAWVRERLGLDPALTVELCVASPFDYPGRALLYLPRDLPAPDDPGFTGAAAARMLELIEITDGRALLLFTSWRALRAAATAIQGQIQHRLLVQGEAPRGALLDAFRADVHSVLLATSSFWEGIDVPGEALSLVVLDKLPFAPPDEPVAAARAARLEEAGRDPFRDYQVPRAAITLKQGFGRLIRRADDRGIVAVLDHRILTRAYGRAFVATLPPAARTSALEQVRRWWS